MSQVGEFLFQDWSIIPILIDLHFIVITFSLQVLVLQFVSSKFSLEATVIFELCLEQRVQSFYLLAKQSNMALHFWYFSVDLVELS